MDKKSSVLLIGMLCFQSCFGREEPSCSKYDFEEKVLEKVVRFEHKIELLSNSFSEISTKVNEKIRDFSAEIETRGTAQTNDLKELSEDLKTRMTELTDVIHLERTQAQNELKQIKDDILERGKMFNDTIHRTLKDLTVRVKTSSYAFSAYQITTQPTSTGDILVFAKTHFNEDEAYSVTTGIYTAPCNGIYEFQATIAIKYRHHNNFLYMEFKADATSIGKFSVSDNYRDVSSSGAVIARIQKGTEVFLRVTAITSGLKLGDDTHRMNSFSGYLISKDA